MPSVQQLPFGKKLNSAINHVVDNITLADLVEEQKNKHTDFCHINHKADLLLLNQERWV